MTDDPISATRAKIAEADAALQRAFAEFGIEPGDHVGRPTLEYNTRAEVAARIADPPASPALPEVIQAVITFEGCGRWIAASLAVVKLRERYEEFRSGDLPADERTWAAFVGKHLAPVGLARVNELLRRMDRGERWPVEAAEQVASTALDRAIAAVSAEPGKSNRALATEIGVDRQTVRRARRILAGDGADSPPDSPPLSEGADHGD
jgi:hypothetical protein